MAGQAPSLPDLHTPQSPSSQNQALSSGTRSKKWVGSPSSVFTKSFLTRLKHSVKSTNIEHIHQPKSDVSGALGSPGFTHGHLSASWLCQSCLSTSSALCRIGPYGGSALPLSAIPPAPSVLWVRPDCALSTFSLFRWLFGVSHNSPLLAGQEIS